MRALNLLRESLHYRKEAFSAGLGALGFQVVPALRDPLPGDVLLIWNRYGRFDDEARRFEAAGATVLVTENGHLGKAWQGGDWYSLAIGHHLGAGRWAVGGPERWAAIGTECAPWRDPGPWANEILVLAQRGIAFVRVAEITGRGNNTHARPPFVCTGIESRR